MRQNGRVYLWQRIRTVVLPGNLELCMGISAHATAHAGYKRAWYTIFHDYGHMGASGDHIYGIIDLRKAVDISQACILEGRLSTRTQSGTDTHQAMATDLAEKIMTEPRVSPDDEGIVWERCHSAIFKVAATLLNSARKIQIPPPSTAEKYSDTAHALGTPAERAS